MKLLVVAILAFVVLFVSGALACLAIDSMREQHLEDWPFLQLWIAFYGVPFSSFGAVVLLILSSLIGRKGPMNR